MNYVFREKKEGSFPSSEESIQQNIDVQDLECKLKEMERDFDALNNLIPLYRYQIAALRESVTYQVITMIVFNPSRPAPTWFVYHVKYAHRDGTMQYVDKTEYATYRGKAGLKQVKQLIAECTGPKMLVLSGDIEFRDLLRMKEFENLPFREELLDDQIIEKGKLVKEWYKNNKDSSGWFRINSPPKPKYGFEIVRRES